ncbi:cation dependent mannose-6-phosphate cargo receptor [Schizosaccharomyces cryophilus OY26]|uniref:Cation dependent mannose-6-phosphate cargo receptor n=1 Tax=Schizosaccharomyces cryophilus (strain OY26 / ATCC MYA-4695 / CBS 11777 / NBRC 106824 / NRRL Y48691) TaxID=653667 RepID=S9VNG4_SCHCR|nr:cation dependent mannose-6-phosphate cargo receptor [Schizosaccharomyces cryophilus OY26]EPY49493.1 cation dependent mannose-6-phosphate cargo receptor [Schizosaccharomyces cryophilus OY26]
MSSLQRLPYVILFSLIFLTKFARCVPFSPTKQEVQVHERASKAKEEPFCSLYHPGTGEFYDLSPLSRSNLSTKGDYSVSGYDFEANFTLNLCKPVTSNLSNYTFAGDIPSAESIGGFFVDERKRMFSIGEASSEPYFRGKKLIMELENGSRCPTSDDLRMRSIISFSCNRDPYASSSISYVANVLDCVFFFEWKTIHACPTVKKEATLSPLSVFLIFCTVAFLAYFVGGCMYNRAIFNARGLRQIPNYELWHSMFSLIVDFSIIAFASFASCFNFRKPSGIRLGEGTANNLDDALIDDIDTNT